MYRPQAVLAPKELVRKLIGGDRWTAEQKGEVAAKKAEESQNRILQQQTGEKLDEGTPGCNSEEQPAGQAC